MAKRRFLLWAMAAMCVALAVFLSVSAVSVYREGSVRREQDPLADIYTPEIAAEKLRAAWPLLLASVSLWILIRISGVKDDRGELPLKSTEVGLGVSGMRTDRIDGTAGRKISAVRMLFLVLGVVLLVLGFLNGSAAAVFSKAVTICTECVGLG